LLARAHADPQRRLQDDVVCADITGDGVVSVDDLLALLASYGSVDRYVDLTGNPEDRACEYRFGGDIGGVTVDGMIAVMWSDVDPSSSATPDAAVFYMGDDDHVVISYVNVAFCCGSPTPDNSFQVTLYPTGAFTLSYDHLATSGQPSWGPLSIGYENNDGTLGEQIAYGWDNAPGPSTSFYVMPESMSLYAATPADYAWADVTTSGTAIANSDWSHSTNTWASDDGEYTVAMDFSFMFFGRPEPEVSIGTNGYITFGSAHYAFGNSMPVPTPGGVLGSGVHELEVDTLIAVMWSDIDPSSGGTVYYSGDARLGLLVHLRHRQLHYRSDRRLPWH
jgi:hypothetical protein